MGCLKESCREAQKRGKADQVGKEHDQGGGLETTAELSTGLGPQLSEKQALPLTEGQRRSQAGCWCLHTGMLRYLAAEFARPKEMINELFSIGPISISPFGVMLVAAFVAAWAQLQWGLKRLGAGDGEDASALVLAAGIGGILGAKIYYAILYREWSLLFERFGLVWYGGFIVGALAVIWVAYRRRLPAWPVLDAATPGLALGYGLGRVGCFLVGDDFGMPTRLPWGVAFPRGLPGPTTAGLMRQEYGAEIPWEIPDHELVAVHPTQLYETLAGILIWAVGVQLIRRGAPAGVTTLTVLGLLAVERFLVEFVRAKDDRFLGLFTVAQLISLLVLALIMALFLARGRRSPGPDPAAT